MIFNVILPLSLLTITATIAIWKNQWGHVCRRGKCFAMPTCLDKLCDSRRFAGRREMTGVQ